MTAARNRCAAIAGAAGIALGCPIGPRVVSESQGGYMALELPITASGFF